MFSGKHEIGSGNGRLSGESKLPDCVIAVSYTNVECPAIDQAGIGFQELRAVFRDLGLSVGEGFAKIDVDHPTYVLYSGMDVGLTARLLEVLAKMVADLGLDHLSEFEHRAQVITTAMTARGFGVDQVYAFALSEDLAAEQTNGERRAAAMGVDNVNSTAQVAAVLSARGAVLTETTPSGATKVDKHVLAGLDDDLARAVLAAKNAGKFLTSYVDPIIEAALVDGRVHPRIRSLAAKTGRQSISLPPLHQLPSGDHRVRACLIPDDGMALVAADFSQVEFRVLALENVFIGASHELGAFESGVTAALLGLTGAVVFGGVGTLAVVAVWWFCFPALRDVDRFDEVRDPRPIE